MRSGARGGRGSRFPEGGGRRARWGRGSRFPEGKGGARWWPGGFMQEGAEGRRFRRVAAVPVCPPSRDRSSGVAVKRVCVALSGCPPLVGSSGVLRRRSSGVAVKRGLRRWPPGAVRWGCAAVDGGAAALLDCPPFGKPAAWGCREAERAGPAERTPAHSVCRSHCRGNREGDRLSRKAIRPGSPFHGGFVPAFGGRIIPMKRIANWNLKTIKL